MGSGRGRKRRRPSTAVRHGLLTHAEIREDNHVARGLGASIGARRAREADLRRSIGVRWDRRVGGRTSRCPGCGEVRVSCEVGSSGAICRQRERHLKVDYCGTPAKVKSGIHNLESVQGRIGDSQMRYRGCVQVHAGRKVPAANCCCGSLNYGRPSVHTRLGVISAMATCSIHRQGERHRLRVPWTRPKAGKKKLARERNKERKEDLLLRSQRTRLRLCHP
ncbi:hypothetical protein V8E53_000255 [Lactarius tabidus]